MIDEKRLAEIQSEVFYWKSRYERSVAEHGSRGALDLLDDVQKLRYHLAERDAELLAARKEIESRKWLEGEARKTHNIVTKQLDERDARIAKLEAALQEIASFKHSDRAEESPWISEEALK